MITAEHLVSLVHAHASGDSSRFYSVALGTAASLVREGNVVGGQKVRNAIDTARAKKDLPPYSGLEVDCKKCTSSSPMVTARYQRSDGREFMERECGMCGHVYYEQCADA